MIVVLSSIVWAESTTVQMKIEHGQIESKGNSISIQMDGFGSLVAPGSYRLPHKRINIILPADADNIQWQANFTKENIRTAALPEKNPPFSDGEKYLSTSSANNIREHVKYDGIGHWGDVTFARFDVLPYIYNESSSSLEKMGDLSININYTRNRKATKNKLAPSIKGNESQFLNPEVLTQEYSDVKSRNYDYLIITKPSLFSALQPLVEFHQQQGIQVEIVPIDSILTSVPGFNDAAKVRNFLVSHYESSPFTYLLLVGDVDTVPIQYLGPEPNMPVTVPSDFYYADLSSNFDSDNDGIPGEYSMMEGIDDDGIDFTPELYVGRIPFNDVASVSQVVTRIISFENSIGDWKNQILIPGAILNYAQEDGNPWPMTNSDTWGEFVKAHIFHDTNVTTMYEQTGLVTSVASDYPLNQTGFTNLLNTNSYGIVNWSAHGSRISSARKIWVNDENLDNIPQGNEMMWDGLVDCSTFDNLANQDGAVFFCASCNNGMLDHNEITLGETVLLKKAVAAIAATRTGWYKIGWKTPGWGGLSSYNYYLLENYVNFHQTIGQALGNMNFMYSNYFLFGDPVDSDGIIWPEVQNIYTYLLFGDPAVGYQGNAITNAGEILVWEPAANAHSSNLIQEIRSVSNMNVVYTDKLIPDYTYLNNFKAIFVLSGFGMNTYYFTNHSDESQLLADYLDNGGKVYLEGDQFSGDMENVFIDKFLTLAPFSHLADIQNIYGFDLATGFTWTYNGYNLMNKPFLAQNNAVSVFKTGTEENSDIIGIYHQTETYRTIASAFELNGVTGDNPGLTEMLHTILFDYFDVDEPTSNHDGTATASNTLINAYPNPFSSTLKIETDISKSGNIDIEVFNIRGQRVRTLISGTAAKGKMETSWDGCDNFGKPMSSGVYLIRLHTSDKSVITKTLLMK
jgi:hypothetical protein